MPFGRNVILLDTIGGAVRRQGDYRRCTSCSPVHLAGLGARFHPRFRKSLRMNLKAYHPAASTDRHGSPRWVAITLCAIVGIGLSATGLLHSGVLHDVIMWDEADYALAAQRGLVANALDMGSLNRDQRHYHAPFSIYGIWLSTRLFGLENWAVRLPGIVVSALTSGLVVLVGYDLARGSRLVRTVVAATAGALFVTAPASILMTNTARPHPFVALFLVLNIWTLCRYLRHPSRWHAAAFGLSLAGQFVSMEYGPVVVGLSLVSVALVRPQRLGLRRRQRSFTGLAWAPPHRDVWVACASCVAAIVAVWPAGFYKLSVLLNFAYYVRYAKIGHRSLFRGHIYHNVPKYAYAWWYGTQYPLLWTGMLVAVLLIMAWAWRRRGAVAVTFAVFTMGLITCVHASHIMELCYSLYMIPPLVLGGPLAAAWLVDALARRRRGWAVVAAWEPTPQAAAVVLTAIAVAAILGGRITRAASNDQDNTKLVAISQDLSRLSGRGDRVLAQSWPVVRYVLLQEGRQDVTVYPYNPANVVSDDLQQRFDAGGFDWIVTAGSTASAAPACPLLLQLHRQWTVVAERGLPPREYRLYGPPMVRQPILLSDSSDRQVVK